jgi:hypothetical protein
MALVIRSDLNHPSTTTTNTTTATANTTTTAKIHFAAYVSAAAASVSHWMTPAGTASSSCST